MPVFHFNLANEEYSPDEEGTELDSIEAARVQAVVFAGSYLSHNPGLVWDGQRFEVQVTDENERMLFTITVETRENNLS